MSILGPKLYLEGAFFYSRWKDLAVRVPIGTTGFNGLVNSKGVRSRGVEFSLASQPFTGLSLTASGAYVDAAYAATVTGTGIFEGGAADEVPRFTANASAEYTRPLSPRADGVLRLSWQHSSPRQYVVSPNYQPGSTIDTIAARAGLDFRQFSVAIFVDNLTNERGAVDARLYTRLATGQFDVSALRLRPRTVGLEANFRFTRPAR